MQTFLRKHIAKLSALEFLQGNSMQEIKEITVRTLSSHTEELLFLLRSVKILAQETSRP